MKMSSAHHHIERKAKQNHNMSSLADLGKSISSFGSDLKKTIVAQYVNFEDPEQSKKNVKNAEEITQVKVIFGNGLESKSGKKVLYKNSTEKSLKMVKSKT